MGNFRYFARLQVNNKKNAPPSVSVQDSKDGAICKLCIYYKLNSADFQHNGY